MTPKPKNGTGANGSGVIRDGYKRPFDLTIIVLAHILLLPLFVDSLDRNSSRYMAWRPRSALLPSGASRTKRQAVSGH